MNDTSVYTKARLFGGPRHGETIILRKPYMRTIEVAVPEPAIFIGPNDEVPVPQFKRAQYVQEPRLFSEVSVSELLLKNAIIGRQAALDYLLRDVWPMEYRWVEPKPPQLSVRTCVTSTVLNSPDQGVPVLEAVGGFPDSPQRPAEEE
jgi:hypothetical protein